MKDDTALNWRAASKLGTEAYSKYLAKLRKQGDRLKLRELYRPPHGFRLIRIAGCKRLIPHAGLLPDDSTTLSKLVSLADERFQELLDDGTIHSNMGRTRPRARGCATSGFGGAAKFQIPAPRGARMRDPI